MNNRPSDDVKKIMLQIRRRQNMPSSEQVVRETFKRLDYIEDKVNQADILRNFNSMLRRMWEETLVTLETYENRTYAAGIP